MINGWIVHPPIRFIIQRMTDHELLKKYEPVLRFAKSERFFPMAVEPYLEKCIDLSKRTTGGGGFVIPSK